MKYSLTSALTLVALAVSTPALAAPQTFTLDPSHTNVYWHASHFGFADSSGRFADVTGTVVLDEAKPETSKVNVVIKTGSVVTGIPKFDDHLKSKDFFNSEAFPDATFNSTKVEVTGEKTAKVTGDFTLLGITKPVTLDVTLNKVGEHPYLKKQAAGFSAETTLKRSEFGIEYGLPGVPDEVKITIQSETHLAD